MGNDIGQVTSSALPVEIGFRVTQVDGGYFIQNFDVFAGNAVRTDLDGVQTYVAEMLTNKFTPNAQSETPTPPTDSAV